MTEINQNELCNIEHLIDLNNLSVFPQGVAVYDIRRELMIWKKIKIPIL